MESHDSARPPGRTEHIFQTLLTAGLILLGATVAWSSAGTSLALVWLLALVVWRARDIWKLAPWREPVLASGLVLLAYIGMRTALGPEPATEHVGSVNRYHELLMLPILWALFRLARNPKAFLLALFVAVAAYAATHWAALASPVLTEKLNSRRISAGLAFAMTAYLSFDLARTGYIARKAGYAFAAALWATALFACDGRTGHLVALALLGCVAWQAAPRGWKVAVLVLTLGLSLTVASLAPGLGKRLDETLSVATTSVEPTQKPTSTQLRLQLWRNASLVAAQNWSAGTGWSGYGGSYTKVVEELRGQGLTTFKDAQNLQNPHSEFLLQIGAGGVAGLFLFTCWLTAPWWARRRHPGAATSTLSCVALAFALACLVNSSLRDFAEGHFYAAVLAWLLAHLQNPNWQPSSIRNEPNAAN